MVHFPGRPTTYLAGPFAATLAPSFMLKLHGQVPDLLFLKLLLSPPNPDGLRAIAAAHEPLRVVPTKLNGTFDAIREAVRIELSEDGGSVTHVGLFGADGDLAYYGCLSGHTKASQPARLFEFREYDIKLKRFHPVDTMGPRRMIGGLPWKDHPQKPRSNVR